MSEGSYPRTPLFAAQQSARYERQRLIAAYEEMTGARLIVMIDQIFTYSVTLIEELIVGADPKQPMHLLLATPGGDGEVAVRLVRALQARCSKLTIVVPDMAKSAGTIMALGADCILMGPTSDLGPVDPQFPVGNRLVGAREIERAVTNAEKRVQEAPATYPLYSGLLADVNMLMVEQARSAMARSYDLIVEALGASGRRPDKCKALAETLRGPLVDSAQVHGAALGAHQAKSLGLPVTIARPDSDQWIRIWQLWTQYFQIGAWPAGTNGVYEGRVASQILPHGS